MSGFYSFVLEQRITFDATPISLAGSTADWTPVQSDDSQDTSNDSQSAAAETDLVGNAAHPLLYAKFDDKGTASEGDDEIGFRLRIGATDASGGFGAIAAIGTDANADGVIDLFLAFDGRTTPTVTFFEPGPGANDAPASTSLQNAVAAAGAESDISLVDATTDPSATDTDLNGDGNTDAFVSFKVLFSDFQNQMSSASGLTVTKDSALQFATFTLTQENAIDGDIGGIDGGTTSNETFTDLGVFSKASSASDLSGDGGAPTPASNEAPRITNSSSAAAAFLQVFENSVVATDIDATDADGDPITFSIIGGADAGLFSIDADTGVLTFNTAPDFENPADAGGNNQYNVNVAATDDEGASDTQNLRIFVRNLDNFLAIDSDGGGDTATVNVQENTTAVTTVSAFNEDGDAITFEIAGGADAARFSIDENTGVLAFTAAPDFESPDSADGDNDYSVIVQANDAGGLSDPQTITVRVTNANEAPTITSNGGGNAASVNAAENQTAVTTVVADDVDGDTVSFSITGGDDAARFGIDSSSGALTFLTAPDFETPGDADGDNQFVVTVQASDGNGGTDIQTITVSVTNANDAPTITSDGGGANAAVNIAEGTTAVTTVAADDIDGDTVSFSITGGDDAARFSIDPNSGALTFQTAPDFETPADANGDNDYVVVVQASDGLGGTATQTLTVTVTDVNDAPVITSGGGGDAAVANTEENTTAVTTVAVSDQNGDAVSFSITGGADAARFAIDPDSGVLRFLTAPDFETPGDADGDNDYVVTVQASDGAGGTDTQTITVTVTDANEAPTITSDGGGGAAAVNIAENTTGLTTVAANDVDGNPVSFSITGGADAAQFDIDPATGALSFRAAPDFETPTDADGDNVYVVTVQASDGAGGVTTQTISATVTNANDAPVITSNGGAPATVDVAENAAAVTTVQAADADGTPVSFSIVGGPDAALFQIDAATGLLAFNTAPDFETPGDTDGDNVYVVTVQASDGAGGTDTQTLSVTVTDTDETVADAPVVIPDPAVPGGDDPSGGSGSGGPSTGDDSSGTNLITGEAFDTPTPPSFEVSPPPETTTPAPEATQPPAEQASENTGESLSDAAADALAEALANLAPAAGGGDGSAADGNASESERAREQVASVENQQRDTEQSSTDQGPALIVDAGIPDTLFEGGSSFTFQLPTNVFSIVGGDPAAGLISDLRMEVTLADGSPLPEWLIFDPEQNEFRGAPPTGEELTFEIRIVATDLLGNEASATFQMILESAAGDAEPRDGETPTNPQQSTTDGAPSSDEMLTTAMVEAENVEKFGENPLSTGETVSLTSSDTAAKSSLTSQIKGTGFGKFQAEALRLALGRSG